MKSQGSISIHRFLMFLAIGLLNTGYGFAFIAGLHLGLGIDLYASNVIVYFVGGVMSYLLNRRFNFRTSAAIHGEAWRYAVCMAIALAASIGALRLFVLSGMPFVAAQLASIAVHAGVAYLLSEFGVFTGGRRHHRSSDTSLAS